jgi:hypothetical protein
LAVSDFGCFRLWLFQTLAVSDLAVSDFGCFRLWLFQTLAVSDLAVSDFGCFRLWLFQTLAVSDFGCLSRVHLFSIVKHNTQFPPALNPS